MPPASVIAGALLRASKSRFQRAGDAHLSTDFRQCRIRYGPVNPKQARATRMASSDTRTTDEAKLTQKGWTPSDRVVIFDGVCVMCNAGVDFLIRQDRNKQFKYAALQSDSGQALARRYGAPSDLSTMIYIEEEKAYIQSEAVLRIGRRLGLATAGLSQIALLTVPRAVRDWMYRNLLAKYRYDIFGKKDQCRLVEPGMEDRFL